MTEKQNADIVDINVNKQSCIYLIWIGFYFGFVALSHAIALTLFYTIYSA